MAEGANPQSQWYSLPTELIAIISIKIADVGDFVRFRCVCKPWRSAAKPQDLSPQAQLPWLLLPYDRTSSSRSFFRLSTRSILTLDLPETRNRIICGSSGGWFLLLGHILKYSLFNPFSRSLLHLPPIIPIPRGFTKANNCLRSGRKKIPLEDMDGFFNCRAYVTSSDAHSVIDGVVVFKHSASSQIRYWRPGDVDWSALDWGLPLDYSPRAFYKGKLYAVDRTGNTAICDLGSEAVAVPSLKLSGDYYLRFFLPLPDDLLVISCAVEIYPYTLYTFRSKYFECRRLVESEGATTWSRLEGVGDYTVFLTNGRCQGQAKLITAVRGAHGYRSNCVYYVVPRNDRRRREDQQLSSEDVFIVEQDTSLQKSCGGPSMELQNSTWISPRLY